MPRLRKAFFNRHVVFITTAIEEGLPLPPNPLMNLIIESALARAQYHHPVRPSHFIFESNHLHLMMIVDDPDDIHQFMCRFKTESAHAINRLLGRKKKTIWCEGYDSPTVLTLEDAVRRIVYIYTNPAKDNLEDHIDKYPGLSSWRSFKRKVYTKKCPYITRKMLYPLKCTKLSLDQLRNKARLLRKRSTSEHEFQIYPDVWMEAFGVTELKDVVQVNSEIERRVRDKESKYRQKRKSEGRSVLGRKRIMLRPMDTPYRPNRKPGRKMWCICSNLELRKAFISTLRQLVKQARLVYRQWKLGDYSTNFPLGLYPPGMPKLANPIGGPLEMEYG